MKAAKLATIAVTYRRQFAFGSLDLALHGPLKFDLAGKVDARAIANATLERIFLPIDPKTDFASGFGHLMGYDAGYYGYAWADAIAADMATVFKKAPDGFFDKDAGMRLRTENLPARQLARNRRVGGGLPRPQAVERTLPRESRLGSEACQGALPEEAPRRPSRLRRPRKWNESPPLQPNRRGATSSDFRRRGRLRQALHAGGAGKTRSKFCTLGTTRNRRISIRSPSVASPSFTY